MKPARAAVTVVPLLLVLLLFAFGCASNQDRVRTAPPEGQELVTYDLGLRLEEGATYAITMDQEMTSRPEVMGIYLQMEQRSTNVYEAEVVALRDDGVMELVVSSSVVDARISMQGPPELNESLQEDVDDLNAPLEGGYDEFAGMEYRLLLGPDGTVISAAGMENLREMLDRTLPAVDEASAQARQIIEGIYSDDFFAQAWEGVFGYIPPGPVAVGESWTVEASVSSGMSMSVLSTYTLADVTEDTFIISVEGLVNEDQQDEVPFMQLDLPGFSMSMAMEGTQSGEIVADRQTGWIVSETLTLTAVGDMRLRQNDPPGMDIAGTFTADIIQTVFGSETTKPLLEPEPVATRRILSGTGYERVRSTLLHMDLVLDKLPEETIAEFAMSPMFELYSTVFNDLGIAWQSTETVERAEDGSVELDEQLYQDVAAVLRFMDDAMSELPESERVEVQESPFYREFLEVLDDFDAEPASQ